MPCATADAAGADGDGAGRARAGGLAPAGHGGEQARRDGERDAAVIYARGCGGSGNLAAGQGGLHDRGQTIDVASGEDRQHRARGIGDEHRGQHEPDAARTARQRLELLVGGIVDEEVREGQPGRPRERAGRGALLLLRDLERDAGGGQTGARALLDQPLHDGHLGAARRAPGRPQRDEVHAAGEGHGVRAALVLEGRQGEAGKGKGRQRRPGPDLAEDVGGRGCRRTRRAIPRRSRRRPARRWPFGADRAAPRLRRTRGSPFPHPPSPPLARRRRRR